MSIDGTTAWRRGLGGEGLPYVDSRIYTDAEIFDEERDKIWKQILVALDPRERAPAPLDFRTLERRQRAPDLGSRRGRQGPRFPQRLSSPRRSTLARARGQPEPGQPVRRSKRISCMFHAWQFNAQGKCSVDSAPQRRLSGSAAMQRRVAARSRVPGGLRRLRLGAPRSEPAEPRRARRARVRFARAAPRGRAARGLSPPQGHRAHELQALARDQQRILSRLHAPLQSSDRHAAARLLRSALRGLPERARDRELDGGQVHGLRTRGHGARRQPRSLFPGARAQRLEAPRSLSGHHAEPPRISASQSTP